MQPAAKKVHLKFICGFSRPLQLTHGLYLTFRGTFPLDGPEGASATWRVVAAEQWERFEVIGDKASVDAGGDADAVFCRTAGGVGDRLSPLGFFHCKIGGVDVIIALLARLCKFRTSILVMMRGLAEFFKAILDRVLRILST